MKDNYDFSNAIKNPFAGREKGKFTVKINYDFTKGKDAYSADAESDTCEDSSPERDSIILGMEESAKIS